MGNGHWVWITIYEYIYIYVLIYAMSTNSSIVRCIVADVPWPCGAKRRICTKRRLRSRAEKLKCQNAFMPDIYEYKVDGLSHTAAGLYPLAMNPFSNGINFNVIVPFLWLHLPSSYTSTYLLLDTLILQISFAFRFFFFHFIGTYSQFMQIIFCMQCERWWIPSYFAYVPFYL